jgi:hypothetical protein
MIGGLFDFLSAPAPLTPDQAERAAQDRGEGGGGRLADIRAEPAAAGGFGFCPAVRHAAGARGAEFRPRTRP